MSTPLSTPFIESKPDVKSPSHKQELLAETQVSETADLAAVTLPSRPTVSEVKHKLKQILKAKWQQAPIFHILAGAKHIQVLNVHERKKLQNRVTKVCQKLAEYGPDDPIHSQKSIKFVGESGVWVISSTLNSDRTISFWFLLPVRLTHICEALDQLIGLLNSDMQAPWHTSQVPEAMWMRVKQDVPPIWPEYQQSLDPLGAEFVVRILLAQGYKCQYMSSNT